MTTTAYRPHALHESGAAYPETNCYTDVVIELLHSRGLEPLAALGGVLTTGHEGDQVTFFKPRPQDLRRLYGVEVHEAQVYRPLVEHVQTQLAQGRTVIVEVDAWWLPDTAGVSYRQQHTKTSVAVDTLVGDRLGYFHNAGRHELDGEDFAALLQPGPLLPGYLEVVRFDAVPEAPLRDVARELLREHLPEARGPFPGLADQLVREQERLLALDDEQVHQLAFATSRMAGAAASVAAAHVRWLLGESGAPAADALDRVASSCRVLTVRLVRRRPFDAAALVTGLDADWQQARELLDAVV